MFGVIGCAALGGAYEVTARYPESLLEAVVVERIWEFASGQIEFLREEIAERE